MPPSPVPPSSWLAAYASPHAAGAAAIEAFLQYLPSRLHCLDLRILARVAREYFDVGASHALDEYVAQGCSLIVICPILLPGSDTTSNHHRRRHRHGQRRQRPGSLTLEPTAENEVPVDAIVAAVRPFFSFVETAAVTVNLKWLECMFADYLGDADGTLRRFAKLQLQTIRILPCPHTELVSSVPRSQHARRAQRRAALAAKRVHDHTANGLELNGDTVNGHASGKTPDAAGDNDADGDDEEDDKDEDKDGTESRSNASTQPLTKLHRPHPWRRNADEMARQPEQAILERLRQRLAPIERQQPWQQIYANLPCPFDERKHPHMATSWRGFWREHGRAVWEREFWVPVSRVLDPENYADRKSRQSLAQWAFQRQVIRRVFQSFGAEFFIEMDRRPEPHGGWWYRGPYVDLFDLYRRQGEAVCWAYIDSQAFARFPQIPTPEGGVEPTRTISMWALGPEVREVEAAVRDLQRRELDKRTVKTTTSPSDHKQEEEGMGGGMPQRRRKKLRDAATMLEDPAPAPAFTPKRRKRPTSVPLNPTTHEREDGDGALLSDEY